LNLSIEKLVSNFAFKWVNLYRYALVGEDASTAGGVGGAAPGARWGAVQVEVSFDP
jgi:hypothetical protein